MNDYIYRRTIETTYPFPTVVTLCGSTRFKDEFIAVNRALTLEGKIVISVGMFGHEDSIFTDKNMDTEPIKHALDELHKRKIDLADEIFVINVGGYIGKSTESEIAYALRNHKRVIYMERPGG
jgi:hypothetical protein